MPSLREIRDRTSAKEDQRNFNTPLGICLARVEYNDDPDRLGRVRIRVPSFHGSEGLTTEYLKTEELPWAEPAFLGGNGEDFGSFIVPVPGTMVWVFFQDNEKLKPVYFATAVSKGPTQPRRMNNLTQKQSPLQKWSSNPGVPDIPKDAFDGKATGVPERHILYKSQKGHTIILDDTDGEESLSIIDRLGQIIKFNSPVSVGDNQGRYARGLASAEKNTQLDKGIDPSIYIRTGETESKKVSTTYQIWMDRVHIECYDSEQEKKTLTHFTPKSFLQKTKDSEIEMLEDSIRIEFPQIKSFYDKEGYYTQAFGFADVFLYKEYARMRFKESMVHMDKDHINIIAPKRVQLKTDKCEVLLEDEDIKISCPGSLSIKNPTCEFSLKDGEGEIKVGGASISFKEGSVYINGKEVHLNEK